MMMNKNTRERPKWHSSSK